jgi:hypothetical protein
MRDEFLEALKLCESLVPPWLRAIYQIALAGIEAAWRDVDEQTAKEAPEEKD